MIDREISAEKRRPAATSPLFVIKILGDLGDDLTLAPERYRASDLGGANGERLDTFVTERAERVVGDALDGAIVFDTTHAKDGVLDVAAAARTASPSSPKKRVRAGDVLVSRLRPYLRQVALVTREVERACGDRVMACSTEFYVLESRDGDSAAFLVPWLLSDEVQAVLAAAQEGGHHPRVPRGTLLAMRVSGDRVEGRGPIAHAVEEALEAFYVATARVQRAMK